jgi:hypothetical protein
MIESPSGIPMIEKIENESLRDDWLSRVEAKAAAYRKAQNAAQDASEALTEAISAARAAGVPEARILTVAAV